MDMVDKHVPRMKLDGTRKQHRKPVWMNDRVLSRIKKKKTAFENYKRTREGKDYLEYCKIRNTAKAETRKAVREYEKEIAKLSKKNPKAFYRHVNSKLKPRTGMSELKDNNGASIGDDKQKAELFNDFFSTVYTLDDQQNIPYEPNLNVTQYLSNIEISKTEVLYL